MLETTVKERPILFSGVMVRAILDGRKKQTRRVMKPQPKMNIDHAHSWTWVPKRAKWNRLVGWTPRCTWMNGKNPTETGAASIIEFCPYGQPGERIWVREAFCQVDAKSSDVQDSLLFRADEELDSSQWVKDDVGWTPSIHMPRWASRITLKVTKVRVERVQDITVGDAHSEGVTLQHPDDPIASVLGEFGKLWDSINSKRGYGWDSNPWVWVVEFERVEE